MKQFRKGRDPDPTVEERMDHWKISIPFGSLNPKADLVSTGPLLLGADARCTVDLTFRISAENLPNPAEGGLQVVVVVAIVDVVVEVVLVIDVVDAIVVVVLADVVVVVAGGAVVVVVVKRTVAPATTRFCRSDTWPVIAESAAKAGSTHRSKVTACM